MKEKEENEVVVVTAPVQINNVEVHSSHAVVTRCMSGQNEAEIRSVQGGRDEIVY